MTRYWMSQREAVDLVLAAAGQRTVRARCCWWTPARPCGFSIWRTVFARSPVCPTVRCRCARLAAVRAERLAEELASARERLQPGPVCGLLADRAPGRRCRPRQRACLRGQPSGPRSTATIPPSASSLWPSRATCNDAWLSIASEIGGRRGAGARPSRRQAQRSLVPKGSRSANGGDLAPRRVRRSRSGELRPDRARGAGGASPGASRLPTPWRATSRGGPPHGWLWHLRRLCARRARQFRSAER